MPHFMVMAAAIAVPTRVAAFGVEQRGGARVECMKRHSRAWCVLDAADLSLKLVDVRRESLDAALKESGVSVVDIAFSAGVASGLLPAPKFGTKWTDLSMVLLSALTEKKPAVLGYNKVIGWMPIEMAPTADEADELLANMIHRAMREALKEYSFQPATFPANPKRARTLLNSDQSGWLLRGPSCPPGHCRLWNRRDRSSNSDAPREGKAPEWAFLTVTPEHNLFGPGAQPVTLNPGLRLPMDMNQGQPWLPVFPEVALKAEGGGK